MTIRGFSWLLWTAGTIVIVLSWTRAVSPQVGWAGFGAALLGTLLSFFAPRPTAPPPPASQDVADLERLSDLRDRGVLSEDEFAAQKKKLLDR